MTAILDSHDMSCRVLLWTISLYSQKTKTDYLDSETLKGVYSLATHFLKSKIQGLGFEDALSALIGTGLLGKVTNSRTCYLTVKGKQAIKGLEDQLKSFLSPDELQRLQDETVLGIATTSNRVNIPEIVVGMKCQVCGRRSDTPVTRKTCCVNKLYVFCSEACLQKWNRDWLRRQEQIKTKKTGQHVHSI